jgi:hypothetical protein
MPFLDREALKDQCGIKTSKHDAEMEEHAAATEVIMRYLVGPSEVEPFNETVLVHRSGSMILRNRPLVSITSVTSQAGGAISSVTITDATGGVVYLGYGCPRQWVTVVGTAGRVAPAANQALAAKIIGQHLWRVRNGGGGAPYPGQVSDDVVMIGSGYAIPRRALELLGMEATPTKVPGIA